MFQVPRWSLGICVKHSSPRPRPQAGSSVRLPPPAGYSLVRPQSQGHYCSKAWTSLSVISSGADRPGCGVASLNGQVPSPPLPCVTHEDAVRRAAREALRSCLSYSGRAHCVLPPTSQARKLNPKAMKDLGKGTGPVRGRAKI